jgi:predicted Zn-dependent protease with MMP-like domain
MSAMGAEDDAELSLLSAAHEAIGEGRFAEALAQLEALDPECGDRWTAAASVWCELGELERAAEALERARSLLGPDDDEVLWVEGRLHLVRWELAEARSAFERLDRDEEGPPLYENLALLAELEGDFARADALYRASARLDPQGSPLPPRLTPERFHALVEEAAGELPEHFRRAFEETAVVIDPMPTAEIVGAPASGHPPDVLGLFVGRSLAEGDSLAGELPPTIFLFQRNLERVARDEDELREEVRVTLYHELGHYLGFDEDGVEELGLG